MTYIGGHTHELPGYSGDGSSFPGVRNDSNILEGQNEVKRPVTPVPFGGRRTLPVSESLGGQKDDRGTIIKMTEEASITSPVKAVVPELPHRAENSPTMHHKQPVRERTAIQNNLDQAQNQLMVTRRKQFELLNQLPETLQDDYDSFFSTEKDQPAIETFINTHSDYQNQLRQITQLQQQGEIETKIVKAAQEELRPVALQDLITEVHRVSSQLDFDTILRDHEDLQTGNYLPLTMLGLVQFRRLELRLISDPNNITLSDILISENVIRRLENEWRGEKYLRDAEENSKSTMTPMDEESILPKKQLLVDKINDFKRFKKLNYDYTYMTGGDGTAIGTELTKIQEVLEEQPNVDPRFLEAANSSILRLIAREDHEGKYSETREAYLLELTQDDPEEVFKNLQIQGTESTLSGITDDRIRTNLQERLPAAMLKDVTTVEIEQIEIEIGKEFGSGFYRHEYDTHGRIINKKLVVKEPYLVNTDRDVISLSSEQAVLYTLAHEVGHNAHMFLTYQEMQDWDKIIAKSTTGVGKSENFARAKGEKKRIKRESFADSFMLFSQNPALLIELENGKQTSENRFGYMAKLFASRCTKEEIIWFVKNVIDSIDFQRKQWEKDGKSPEQAENEYLEKIKVTS